MDYLPPPKQNHRHDRAEEMLVHLAAKFIVRESNGTSLITATRAELSHKEDRAVIYVSVFPNEATPQALNFLNRNADEFREYLKDHARLRGLPRVNFVLDEGERNRQRLDELGREA